MAIKYRYEIREIDAWRDEYDGEPCWTWNTSYLLGTMETAAKDVKKAFSAWLREKHGIAFKLNRTLIEDAYGGDILEIQDRKTKEPLFAAILQEAVQAAKPAEEFQKTDAVPAA